jgi:hypothetical protein
MFYAHTLSLKTIYLNVLLTLILIPLLLKLLTKVFQKKKVIFLYHPRYLDGEGRVEPFNFTLKYSPGFLSCVKYRN